MNRRRFSARLTGAGVSVAVLPVFLGVDPFHGSGWTVWAVSIVAGMVFAMLGDVTDPRPRYRPTRSHHHKLPRR